MSNYFSFSNTIENLLYIIDASHENSIRFTALLYASSDGWDDIIEMLLNENLIKTRSCFKNAILNACENGHHNVVKLLLQDPRADPSVDSNLPIREACGRGYTKLVKILLKDGRTDPTCVFNSPIREASSNGFYDIVKILLEDGRADPNEQNGFGKSALDMAIKNGHTEIVQLLNDHIIEKKNHENI